MLQEITGIHGVDDSGNPAGGETTGTGIEINWQNGPLGNGIDTPRAEPNGAFVEGVIAAAIDRLEYYQDSKFNCFENEMAIVELKTALCWCQRRTVKREVRKVEGTHVV